MINLKFFWKSWSNNAIIKAKLGGLLGAHLIVLFLKEDGLVGDERTIKENTITIKTRCRSFKHRNRDINTLCREIKIWYGAHAMEPKPARILTRACYVAIGDQCRDISMFMRRQGLQHSGCNKWRVLWHKYVMQWQKWTWRKMVEIVLRDDGCENTHFSWHKIFMMRQ